MIKNLNTSMETKNGDIEKKGCIFFSREKTFRDRPKILKTFSAPATIHTCMRSGSYDLLKLIFPNIFSKERWEKNKKLCHTVIDCF